MTACSRLGMRTRLALFQPAPLHDHLGMVIESGQPHRRAQARREDTHAIARNPDAGTDETPRDAASGEPNLTLAREGMGASLGRNLCPSGQPQHHGGGG